MKKLLLTLALCFSLTSSALAAFPTTSVLDNFNRADAGNLGANWSTFSSNLQIVSNKATSTELDATAIVEYTASSFGANQEVYVTASTWNNADPVQLYMKIDGSLNGYAVAFSKYTSEARIYKITGGSSTQQGATISQSFSDGNVVGGSYIDGTINIYLNGSSIGSRSETTYQSQTGYLVLQEYSGSIGGIKLDDFGGGTVVAATSKFPVPALWWMNN